MKILNFFSKLIMEQISKGHSHIQMIKCVAVQNLLPAQQTADSLQPASTHWIWMEAQCYVNVYRQAVVKWWVSVYIRLSPSLSRSDKKKLKSSASFSIFSNLNMTDLRKQDVDRLVSLHLPAHRANVGPFQDTGEKIMHEYRCHKVTSFLFCSNEAGDHWRADVKGLLLGEDS